MPFVVIRQTRHLVLLSSGRNAHRPTFVRSRLKSTGKSILCTQVSQSIDNHVVDQVSRFYAKSVDHTLSD